MRLFEIFRRKTPPPPPEHPLIVARGGLLLPNVTAWAPSWDTFEVSCNEERLRTALASQTQVVIAFRVPGGELHPEGVIADVLAAEPFESGIESKDYGASQRYSFAARRRCRLPDAVCRSGTRPETVAVDVLPERSDDSLPLPAEVEERYGLLARSGHGWLRRFELCRGKPLGYWILYALQGEPELAWFDSPGLVVHAIRSDVERMVPVIVPEARATAIARELAPRTPISVPERLAFVASDVAVWVLYHPRQLAEAPLPVPTTGSLIGPTNQLEHFRLGLLVAVDTGSDGEFAIRFTGGELTPAERAHAGSSCDFGLVVTEGRLFLWGGFTDGLDDADLGTNPDSWIDIPNGTWRARVTCLSHYERAGDDWPGYVVQLTPSETLIEPPARRPRLEYYGDADES